MKRLFVWLASVSICAAQAVSIGPFATEDWVDERLQVLTNDFATIPYVDDLVDEVENKIPDVSGFATKEYVDAVSNAIPDTSAFSTIEYVNTTSNNLALLMDDLVSEEELGSSVSNVVPSWALVPVPPVTVEVDPAFTNWLNTTNYVWLWQTAGNSILFDRDGIEILNIADIDDVVEYNEYTGAGIGPSLEYKGTSILFLDNIPAFERVVDGSTSFYVLSNKLDGSVTRFGDFARIYSTGNRYLAISNAEYSVKPVLWDSLDGYDAISFGGTSYDYVVEGGSNQVYDLPNHPYTMTLRYGPLSIDPVGGYYSSYDGFSFKFADNTFHPVTGEWVSDGGASIPYLDLETFKFVPARTSYIGPGYSGWDGLDKGFSVSVPVFNDSDYPTNTVSFDVFPDSYTYFDSYDGLTILRNKNGRSFNLTHPRFDYITVTNSDPWNPAHLRLEQGWNTYSYVLPTDYVEGTWVLARTNDIPAAIDRSLAGMTDIPMFWDHDSITNRNTGNTFDLSKFAEQEFVYSLDSQNAKPEIDDETSSLRLSWGIGVPQFAYLPYYGNPSEFPKIPEGVITTNGNGSVNVFRLDSNIVSGNDNFVFGNNNSVSGNNVTVFGNGNIITNSNHTAVFGPGHTVKNSDNSIASGNGSNNLENSSNSIITGAGGTNVRGSYSSFVLSGGGGSVESSPYATYLAPANTGVFYSRNVIVGGNSHNVVSNAAYSVVLGGNASVTNQYVFMWNGDTSRKYSNHGPRTFNVNPLGGLSGFWIGDKNLETYLETMDNVLYKSTTIEGSESAFQSLKYYDLLDTFVGSRRANRYVSLYGALYVGEKADLVSTAFDPNPGGFTLSVGRGNTEARGRSSVALGNNVTTSDDDSFVTGYGGKVTGKIGFASGKNTRAKGNVSTATGEGTTAAGYASSSSGWYTLASAGTSQAHGKYVWASDSDSWAWSAGFDSTNAPRASLWTAQHADNIESLTNGFYESHGPGTFNIDPIGGTEGFWIGETNLATHLDSSSKIALDAIAPAFSASNVYTNGDYVIYDMHLYECTNYTGTAGWRAGDWQQTTVTGILGNLRSILDAINGEAL